MKSIENIGSHEGKALVSCPQGIDPRKWKRGLIGKIITDPPDYNTKIITKEVEQVSVSERTKASPKASKKNNDKSNDDQKKRAKKARPKNVRKYSQLDLFK